MGYVLKSLEEANSVDAVRLTNKGRRPKVGDIFRLSPAKGLFLWGRLVKRAHFFGLGTDFNLVYIYDAIGDERPPASKLSPANLILGPRVVNNLGWSRGYWEVIANEPVTTIDLKPQHLFVRFRGFGGPENYDLVDESGDVVRETNLTRHGLSQSGIGNFNSVDWDIRAILKQRGLLT